MTRQLDHAALATEIDEAPLRADAALREMAGGRDPSTWDYPLANSLMQQLEAIAKDHPGLALRLMAALYDPASNLFAHDICDAISIWFQELKRPEVAPYLEKRLSLMKSDDDPHQEILIWIRYSTRT